MKYLIMECHMAYAVVLDEDGRFLKAANMDYEVGQTVDTIMEIVEPGAAFSEADCQSDSFYDTVFEEAVEVQPAVRRTSRLSRWLKSALPAAAALCLLLSGGHYFIMSPYGTVRLSINPEVELSVNRLSEQADIIPLMVSERLVDVHKDYRGLTMEAIGQFRSYNRHEGTKNRLVLSIFVREIHFLEEFTDYTKTNQIFLDGYICKDPIYRKTPLGREIADLLLAVNRPYGKSDYIPCICWGRNARYASAFEVGGHVLIWGRIQSRDYMKKIGENETEKRTAYEVSVSKLEYLE